ncbi:SgcJ/EcaC family oxidoreductase [Nocardia rhamnosiphila]|uniref:SgcJ/EcaC family oxidoreductase n=1 Tax=Nocardia rhamnosiphila TaxID=426716 RepID=UPI0033F2C2E0
MSIDKKVEDEIHALLQAQLDAWAAGDGSAFAATFTEDAVFVSVFGEYLQGRHAIALTVQEGLNGFMKGTRMPEPEILSLRTPVPATAVLTTRAGRPVPPGTTRDPSEKSIQTRVAVRSNGNWLFSSFQNTRRAD